MRLKWGTYVHDEAEVAVAMHVEPLRDQADRYWAYKWKWMIRGVKYATTQAALITALTTLENAYLAEAKDLILYSDYANSTIGSQMLTQNSVGGTRVMGGVHYPEDGQKNAEFSTFRTFEVQVEATFHTGAVDLLAWQESMSYQGTGGPAFVYAEPLTGPPQKQQVKQFTPTSILQQGSAIGRLSWPTPAPPAFPFDEDLPLRDIQRKTPKRTGLPGLPAYTEFEISWKYVFKAITFFPVAFPMQWPAAQ